MLVFGIALSMSLAPAMGAPKRILVLQSNGQDFKPWSDYVRTFRQELELQSSLPMIVQHFTVALAPDGEQAGSQLAAYLTSLYSRDAPDLIVAFGAPATTFLQQHRSEFFPAVPALFAAVDERRVSQMSLTAKDAKATVWIDIPALFENILRLLPETKTIAIVIGSSPNEEFWLSEMRSRLRPLADRVNLVFWNDLSFEEILKQAASLPGNSAIFWVQPRWM